MEKAKKVIINRKTIIIDARHDIAGRLASKTAKILIGKTKSSYLPYIDAGNFVKVINIKDLKFSGKKVNTKLYFRTSGYLGGLKTTKMSELLVKKPAELFKKMVFNMLPKNKLRKPRTKRLIIK